MEAAEEVGVMVEEKAVALFQKRTQGISYNAHPGTHAEHFEHTTNCHRNHFYIEYNAQTTPIVPKQLLPYKNHDYKDWYPTSSNFLYSPDYKHESMYLYSAIVALGRNYEMNGKNMQQNYLRRQHYNEQWRNNNSIHLHSHGNRRFHSMYNTYYHTQSDP